MEKSFKIKIDDSVLAYMNKKRKRDLTLTISSTGGGCCPTFEISEVSLIKPDQSDSFNIFQQNDVTVYISKNAKVIAPTLWIGNPFWTRAESPFIDFLISQGKQATKT